MMSWDRSLYLCISWVLLFLPRGTAVASVEIGSFAPAPTPSADIENLTARSFEEKVMQAVNSSAYIAMILFWNQDTSDEAIEFYRNAKSRLDNGVRSREFTLFRPVRFFMMDCGNQAANEMCQRYTDNKLPSLLSFRGSHVIRFSRNWCQEAVSYWVGRASRPAYVLIDNMEQWQAQQFQPVPCFLLILQKADPSMLKRYEDLAVELLEFRTFHVAVDNGGDVWKDLPGTRPSMHFLVNKEMSLEAPPFEFSFDQEPLRAWAIISSLPAMQHLNFYIWELIPIGWTVVVLRHHGNNSAVDHFAERAQAMRAALRFSFAHLDVSSDGGNYLARTIVPLVASHWEDYIPYLTDVQAPRIFAFTKTSAQEAVYWDTLTSFPSPEDFQLDDVEHLMRNNLPLDSSDVSSWLGLFLRFERFGSRSWIHRLIWLMVPLSFCYVIVIFYLFIKAVQESFVWEDGDNGHQAVPEKSSRKSRRSKKIR
eukprot:symbB.v1.2.019289.t1/scaffold1574.1/size208356/2